jgi:hypothetical protein
MLDSWNPKTFSAEICSALSDHSELIRNYCEEDRKLMEEHLNSSPYQSLKSNQFHLAYSDLREQILAPILASSRIRVWHYTRLTDDEADSMRQQLALSTLDHLKDRLETLVASTLLTRDEAEIIYAESPFHAQLNIRTGRLWTTNIPLPPGDSGVLLLLESWGGESAYFWLSNKMIAAKLKKVGSPRIVELETALSDNLNGYSVSDTVLKAWAKKLGIPVQLSGCDLPITNCIDTAKVVRVHTKGDSSFEAVATAYPEDARALLGE